MQIGLGVVECPKALPRRSNRLVGLLGVFDLAVVATRSVGDVVVAVKLAGLAARGPQCLVGECGGVGPHVGNPTLLVETLSGAHCAFGIKAQFAARFDL